MLKRVQVTLGYQSLDLFQITDEEIHGSSEMLRIGHRNIPPHLGRARRDPSRVAKTIRTEVGLLLRPGGIEHEVCQRGGHDMRQVARTAYQLIMAFGREP